MTCAHAPMRNIVTGDRFAYHVSKAAKYGVKITCKKRFGGANDTCKKSESADF